MVSIFFNGVEIYDGIDHNDEHLKFFQSHIVELIGKDNRFDKYRSGKFLLKVKLYEDDALRSGIEDILYQYDVSLHENKVLLCENNVQKEKPTHTKCATIFAACRPDWPKEAKELKTNEVCVEKPVAEEIEFGSFYFAWPCGGIAEGAYDTLYGMIYISVTHI